MGQGSKNQPFPNPLSPWVGRFALLLALVLPLLTGAFLAWHSLGELDVWLHQRAGNDILQGKGFPHRNTYSYTHPDHPWTNHEWLFQVLVASVGPNSDALAPGILRWNLLRVALTLLLLVTLLAGDRPWRAPPEKLLAVAPGLLLGVILLWTRVLLRPELLSFLFLVLLVRQTEKPLDRTWTWKQILAPGSREGLAFIITLIWAQCHGFAALAPALWLLAGLLGFFPATALPRIPLGRLMAGTLLLLVALLLTPYGVEGFLFPLKALGQFSATDVKLNQTISELVPLFRSPDGLFLTLWFFRISLVWGLLMVVLNWRNLNLLRVGLWILAAVAAIMAQRNLGFYALTFLLLHGSTPLRANQFPLRLPKFPRWSLIFPSALAMLLVLWFWPSLMADDFYLGEGESRRFGSGATVARYPFLALDKLAETPGRQVFANLDAAAPSLSRGKARVFIDGRTEAYPPESWSQYQQLRQGGPDAHRILAEADTRSVLINISGSSFHPLLRTLLQSGQWQIQTAEEAGILLTRLSTALNPAHEEVLATALNRRQDPGLRQTNPTREADRLASLANLAGFAGLSRQREQLIRQGLNKRPDHPLLNHNLGNQLLQNGQPELALGHFRKALRRNPRLAGTYLNAGVCQMSLKRFPKAAKLFEKATDLQPDNFQNWVNLSLALQQVGQKEKAVRAMVKAVDLNPGNQRLVQALQKLRSSP